MRVKLTRNSGEGKDNCRSTKSHEMDDPVEKRAGDGAAEKTFSPLLKAVKTAIMPPDKADRKTMVPTEVFTTMRVNPIHNQDLTSITSKPCILTQFPSFPNSLKLRVSSSSLDLNHPQNQHQDPGQQSIYVRIPLLKQHIERLPLAINNLSQTFPQTWNLETLMGDASDHDSGYQRKDSDSLIQRNVIDRGEEEGESSSCLSDLLIKAFPPRIFLSRISAYLDQLEDDLKNQTLRLRLSLNSYGKIGIAHGVLSSLSSSSTLPKVKLDPQPLPSALEEGPRKYSSLDKDKFRIEIIDKITLGNKTNSREIYSRAAKRVGANYGVRSKAPGDSDCFDVLLWASDRNGSRLSDQKESSREKGKSLNLMTESSIANLLVEIPKDLWNQRQHHLSSDGLCGGDPEEKNSHSTPASVQELALKTKETNETEETIFLTPRLRSDLAFLPGLMRAELIRLGVIKEADITLDDLERWFSRKSEGKQRGQEIQVDRGGGSCRLYLCNALRGVWQVEPDLE